MAEVYIGTKVIIAEPQEKDGRAGYKVVYDDGYTSWSPRDVFERAYRRITEAEIDSVTNKDLKIVSRGGV